jgi:hypothetical protein
MKRDGRSWRPHRSARHWQRRARQAHSRLRIERKSLLRRLSRRRQDLGTHRRQRSGPQPNSIPLRRGPTPSWRLLRNRGPRFGSSIARCLRVLTAPSRNACSHPKAAWRAVRRESACRKRPPLLVRRPAPRQAFRVHRHNPTRFRAPHLCAMVHPRQRRRVERQRPRRSPKRTGSLPRPVWGRMPRHADPERPRMAVRPPLLGLRCRRRPEPHGRRTRPLGRRPPSTAGAQPSRPCEPSLRATANP